MGGVGGWCGCGWAGAGEGGARARARGRGGGRQRGEWRDCGRTVRHWWASALQLSTLRLSSLLAPPRRRRSVFGGTRSRQVVHRLALFDAEGHLSHVISQSDVIKWVVAGSKGAVSAVEAGRGQAAVHRQAGRAASAAGTAASAGVAPLPQASCRHRCLSKAAAGITSLLPATRFILPLLLCCHC